MLSSIPYNPLQKAFKKALANNKIKIGDMRMSKNKKWSKEVEEEYIKVAAGKKYPKNVETALKTILSEDPHEICYPNEKKFNECYNETKKACLTSEEFGITHKVKLHSLVILYYCSDM